MATSYNFCHKLVAALLVALVSVGALANPLEDAAEQALRLCSALEAESIEYCGTEMGGRSPQHSAARKAVGRLFEQRNAFLRLCQHTQPFERCVEMADWYIGSGVSRLNKVTYETSPGRR